MLDLCLAKSYVFEVFEVCFEQNESKRQLSLGVKHRSGTHTQKHTSSISTCAKKEKDWAQWAALMSKGEKMLTPLNR